MKKTLSDERRRELIADLLTAGSPHNGSTVIIWGSTIPDLLAVLKGEIAVMPDPLPWKVSEGDGSVVAAFRHEEYAGSFRSQVHWHESRKPITFTGPDDDATDDPAPPRDGDVYHNLGGSAQ